jgi:hypothetical protein
MGALTSAHVRPLGAATLTLGAIVVIAGMTPVQVRHLASPGTYLEARRWIEAPLQSTSLMQREHRVATALAAFPAVSALRIAFADSGVIPYHSRALWLDLVGLTDPAIARASNRETAVDHVFAWQPDVAIIPATRAHHWLRTGHGVLGNYEAWMRDARWDAYAYAGTIQTSSSYDLQVLIRAASDHRPSLDRFLLEHVLDGVHPTLPLAVGTRAAGTAMPTCRDLPPPTVCPALPPRAGVPNLP